MLTISDLIYGEENGAEERQLDSVRWRSLWNRKEAQEEIMDGKETLKYVDHTLLTQTTWEEIRKICDEAMEFGPRRSSPSYVKAAKEYMKDRMAVCTVIGFPNGYSTTAVKAYETKDAIRTEPMR